MGGCFKDRPVQYRISSLIVLNVIKGSAIIVGQCQEEGRFCVI